MIQNKNNIKVPQLQTIKMTGHPLIKHSAKMNSMVLKKMGSCPEITNRLKRKQENPLKRSHRDAPGHPSCVTSER